MRLIDRYFLSQTLAPFLFFTFVLTAVIWLAQSLRVIDLIVNNGQSASILFQFAVPLMPRVLSVVLPLATLGAVIFGLSRLMQDSELVVVYAAGQRRLSAIRAVLIFGAGITVLLALVTIVLVPLGQRAFKDRTAEVRGDIAAALIQDGRFMHPSSGLTVYIREANGPGDMRGVLVHDSRDADAASTFHAERGALVKAEEGPRLVMFNGLAHRVEPQTEALTVLRFDKIAYDLSEFIPDPGARSRKPNEYFFWDLVVPDPETVSERDRGRFISEGHEQLSSPLYGFAIAVVAAAGLLGGSFSRRGYFWRMCLAAVLGFALRLGGFALGNATRDAPELWPLMYALPLLGTALGLWFLARGHFPEPEPPRDLDPVGGAA